VRWLFCKNAPMLTANSVTTASAIPAVRVYGSTPSYFLIFTLGRSPTSLRSLARLQRPPGLVPAQITGRTAPTAYAPTLSGMAEWQEPPELAAATRGRP
jgi:hypothetical protein